jgi:arylsulfatase A-like enzyme
MSLPAAAVAKPPRNILFVMVDQLRFDYLSCHGASPVATPHIDALARRGVRFTRAYVQGTSCGNSRASFYTGRHVRSHGATWNDVPLPLGEWTLAEYLAPLGLRTVLMGKTHMKPDRDGLRRLGIDPDGEAGRFFAESGFVQGERDDGLHPEGPLGFYADHPPRYNDHLRRHGWLGRNPWQEWANGALDEHGRWVSGFFLRHAHLPARVPAEHSETAYMTSRAIEEITALGDNPWCMHLSYIKPHWPLMAPAPYHAMHGPEDVPPARRTEAERHAAHPIHRAFMDLRVARTWSRDEVRRHAIPAYMGLVKQLDDELGRLLAHLRALGRDRDTMIVLTADHGDYLGDHWLGEKDLFHDAVVRVPMIVVDPTPAADATRGRTSDALVAAIDLLPTFIEALGGSVPRHRLEGRSLLPLLRGQQVPWREAVFSECDYARLPVAAALGRHAFEARLTMAFDGRHKFIHCPGFAPMLFDLQDDPDELVDRGSDPAAAGVRERMKDRMLDWCATLRNRTAFSESQMRDATGRSHRQGVLIGFWSEDEVPAAQRLPSPS